VLGDSNSSTIVVVVVVSRHVSGVDVNVGEAHTGLLAVSLATSYGCNYLH
jgi:hypothetical protein